MFIKGPAVLYDGTLYKLPPPADHAEIRAKIALVLGHEILDDLAIDGFVTNEEGFMNRFNAAALALENGQASSLSAPPVLSCNDLWNKTKSATYF